MALPPAPKRASFGSPEEFEEATGFWQNRVGRILGMRGVKQTADRRSMVQDPEMAEALAHASVRNLIGAPLSSLEQDEPER